MRALILLSLFLAGCGDTDSGERKTNGYVVPANGDPANFTWSGFPRHRYAACGKYIELSKPFEVVPSSWGEDPLAVPLSYLDNPKTDERTPEGIDESQRVSFGFPAHYRGEGMSEWQEPMKKKGHVQPVTSASAVLKAAQAKGGSYADEETYFQGSIDRHSIAMTCTMVTVPNPWCDIEVKLGSSDQRFNARLPPAAVNKLNQIIVIGEKLFQKVANSCGRNPQPRSTEIKIIHSRAEAEKHSSTRPVPAP
jgi:hypothetical protein